MDLREEITSGARVDLTWEEIGLLNSALNEVLHGIDVREFSTRLGATREEARWLLDQTHDLLERRSRPPN